MMLFTDALDTKQNVAYKMGNEYLCFDIGNEHYAHSISAITKIIRYDEPNPVPGSPTNVVGVLNVRGEVMTIISGQKLFHLQPTVPADHWKIILFDDESSQYGVVVDDVDQLVTFEPRDIEPERSTTGTDFIKGTCQYNDGLLVLVDFIQESVSLV